MSVTVRKACVRKPSGAPNNGFWSAPGIPTACGAIYPPMMYVIMALDLLGYPEGSPVRQEAESSSSICSWTTTGGSTSSRVSPWFGTPRSPPIALGESGLVPDHAMREAADWLLTKEVRRKGDWASSGLNVEPSGWYFEFANEFYPDIDDTAQVLLALARAARRTRQARRVMRRAVDWLLAMQSKDGGWAAFDVDNNWDFLSSVPFADHNAMLDPTCPDITGRVLEALCACGRRSAIIRRCGAECDY